MNINICITCGAPINNRSKSTLHSICYLCRANRISENHLKDWYDSPLEKHVRDLEESSTSKYLRDLEESSASRHLRDLGESSTSKYLRDLEESTASRHLRDLEESSASKYLRDLEESSASRHLRDLGESSTSKYLRDLEESRFLQELQTPKNCSFLNDIDGFRSVSDYLAGLISPSAISASSLPIETWQSTLFDRLGSLRVDWLDPDPIKSIAGFSHLARLSDFIDINDPFSDSVARLLDKELGEPLADSSQIDSNVSNGFNLDIAAFDDDHYSEIIKIAGFEIDLSKFDTTAYSPDDGTPVKFCHESSYTMQILENALRLAITKIIRRIGLHEKNVLPGQILENCRRKQQTAREKTGSSFSLIYYTDFMELLSLIIGGKLWKGHFEKVFMNKNDIQASFERIHPIRIELAHHRPISKFNYFCS